MHRPSKLRNLRVTRIMTTLACYKVVIELAQTTEEILAKGTLVRGRRPRRYSDEAGDGCSRRPQWNSYRGFASGEGTGIVSLVTTGASLPLSLLHSGVGASAT